ncbi:MAG TPA: zinc-dependent metalloprotease [Acidimicrobiales bacterium]|nr:zinc-dependent metalloprotease [Acidimicrobiales bacterium]
MSTPEGFGAGGPFDSGPLGELMRNLARFFTSQGPLNWEIARQMAHWAASEGQPEANPDPVSRVRLEELIRVAEMHVSEATGLTVAPGGVLTVAAVTPSGWALRTLEHWKPLLEQLATRMIPPAAGPGGAGAANPFGGALPGGAEAGPGEDPMARLFGSLPQVLGPFLLGLQSGSMVGQLATGAMGQFDLPMPRPAGGELMLVPATIDRFASDWSLAPDDVRMWICLRETTNLAVLGRAHVRSRLEQLISDYVQAFSPTSRPLEERMEGIDITDMAGLQAAFGDPASLVEEMQNDAQRRIQVPLRALLSAVVGYVDYVMDGVGRRLIGSYGPLTEALRRQRLEETPGAKILGQMFGVALGAEHYEQGQAFVHGVLERAGTDGLAKLWRSERDLPTPAEVAAPGLWLARLELDDPDR